MSGHIVVGYTATKTGRDAVAFAARLASAVDAVLDVVVVLPGEGRSVITPPDASYDRLLREQAARWIAEAIDRIPAEVVAHAHVRTAESFAEGLIAVADELEAAYIVVGAADGATRGRHRLGTTTTELLHSSDVPVVLVPRGARKIAPETGITRLTVAVGTRPGADALMDDAAALVAATGVPVRLLSLLTVDLPPTADTGAIRIAGSTQVDEVLAAAQTRLPDGLDAEVVVAEGESIEDAVAHLDWQPGELLLAGSSRLAQPRRLFLGSTAAKMLHEVPVPVVVVPRTRHKEEAGS
ncbi:universal stress protein [Microbacterium sp. LjRoot45]|uniref:universal stress protein n=1 Tax=Microbacterium sp. LjRoot45 TaxID=3342329 RepID=UPI003ED073C5